MPPAKSSAIRITNPPTQQAPTSRQGFQDLDVLTKSDGITAVISQRSRDGALTLGMFRVFERQGEMSRTSYIPEYLIESYLAQVQMARERMKQLRESGSLPFPVSKR